ncbi:MAG: phospho-sugar mutase [Polyangiaceae bacterium]
MTGEGMDAIVRARAWMTHDPDPEARAELGALVDAAVKGDATAARDLGDRFSGPLEFGTAGLRGVLGAGETRMNRAVVRRTCFGLAQHLLAIDEDVKRRGVVIGYDGRRMSRAFAEDSVGVLSALGIPSFLSPDVCPTPLTAYAVTRLGASAGIMVTASHNPPEYNGYKVYWGNGAQIIPPIDAAIAAQIAAAPPADEIPIAPLDEAREMDLMRDFPLDLEPAYIDGVVAMSPRGTSDRDAPIVHTALHGVGSRLVRLVFERCDFGNVHSVREQEEPDGAFPTVAFPNPEEKGALDLAYALARERGAELIIANDPDVDRLAIAIRANEERAHATHGFVQLTGNEVGVLLGHYLLTREGPPAGPEDRMVVASCVSSPMLGVIAEKLGVHYEETLTGFKWIANRAMEVERTARKRFVFGYEEALGYTVGTLVRDKDGISAALVFAELWAARRAEGKSMFDELEALYRRYGLFVSGQVSITMKGADGVAKIRGMMERLRADPPSKVGDLAVLTTTDVARGTRRAADGTLTPVALPTSDVLLYALEGKNRVIARPSGTEPKIKFYFDVCEPIADGEPLPAAEARAAAKMEKLKAAFVALAGG